MDQPEAEGELMANLIRTLTIIFIVFTIICILFCIEAYLRYRRKDGIDKDEKYHSHYQYFVQTIYGKDNQITGYELLLREYSAGRWQLPNDVRNFPLNLVAEAISDQRAQLEDPAKFVAINMTVSKLLDFRAENFLNWVSGALEGQQLVLELDRSDVLSATFFRRQALLRVLKMLVRDFPNVHVAIEEVDSSKYCYDKLSKFLPWIAYVKFDATAFNKSKDHWLEVTLGQWQRKLAKYQVQEVLARVEDADQDALAKQLNIDMRQGYLYQKPQQIEPKKQA